MLRARAPAVAAQGDLKSQVDARPIQNVRILLEQPWSASSWSFEEAGSLDQRIVLRGPLPRRPGRDAPRGVDSPSAGPWTPPSDRRRWDHARRRCQSSAFPRLRARRRVGEAIARREEPDLPVGTSVGSAYGDKTQSTAFGRGTWLVSNRKRSQSLWLPRGKDKHEHDRCSRTRFFN